MKEKKKKLQSQADLGSQAYSSSQLLVCSMGWSRYKELSRVSGAWGQLRECSYPCVWMDEQGTQPHRQRPSASATLETPREEEDEEHPPYLSINH